MAQFQMEETIEESLWNFT